MTCSAEAWSVRPDLASKSRTESITAAALPGPACTTCVAVPVALSKKVLTSGVIGALRALVNVSVGDLRSASKRRRARDLLSIDTWRARASEHRVTSGAGLWLRNNPY